MQKKSLSPVQIITLSFAAVVLVGTFLLTLPFASRDGVSVPMIDALFTATSASCVTGLAVYDTLTQWSAFGQAVILLLIQVGGIGIITLVMYFLSAMRAKIGMRNVFVLQESIGAESSAGLLKMTRFITAGVLLQEAVGALLLFPAFLADFPWDRALWCAVFHSVSAFCNAGFDILGGGTSLIPYGANAYVCIVIAMLVILGGLGFFVWLDILRCRFRFRKFALHTKLVVVTSAALILFGTVLFLLLYSDSPAAKGVPFGERLLVSFFQSVSARTAGFASVDLAKIGAPAQMLMIVLMLIGGSSASTAGGIKTTTFAVVVLFVRSIFRGKEDVEAFGRRIDRRVIRTAIAVFVLYLGLALAAGIAICAIEDADIVACLFEAFSAMATVGYSLSLSPTLSFVSKLIVIALMFLGRVGGITVLLSLMGKKNSDVGKYPVENITVG